MKPKFQGFCPMLNHITHHPINGKSKPQKPNLIPKNPKPPKMSKNEKKIVRNNPGKKIKPYQ